MSHMGQSRPLGAARQMTGLPAIADIVRTFPHVRVVPISDIAPGRLRLNFGSLNHLRDDWLVVQAKDFLAPRWWAVVFDDLSSETDPCIDAGRPRCMRHRLPHAWRAGRGMQVLLFPLRTFGDGGTGELVDGGIAARALVNPIAACINHARYLPIAWNIFAAIPAVPFRLDFGGDGHAANL